jgi:hypothetical protein
MKLKGILLLCVSLFFSAPVTAGSMYKVWLDCDPAFKLWEVSWKGSWDTFQAIDLVKGKTNRGPWKVMEKNVPDRACIFPGQNRRWYAIRKFHGSPTNILATIWIPRHRCLVEVP